MGTLNLLVHGLFTIVEEPFRLVVAVPFVSDHHYLFGNFIDAGPYGRGTYEFTGLVGGHQVLDPRKVAKIEGTRVLTTAPPAHSVFTLPRPWKTYHCHFVTKGDAVDLSGDDSGQVKTTRFPLFTVLSYPFDDVNAIRVRGLPGFRAKYSDTSQEFVNIVIFAANPERHALDVAAGAFGTMMHDLVPDKQIDLVVYDHTTIGSPGPCHIPGIPDQLIEKMLKAEKTGIHVDLTPDDCIWLAVDNTQFDQ